MRAPFSGAPKASLTSKALTACAAATLALGLGVGTASALPPGGAKASTPGTSSTVSSSVNEHGVISFSVSGFPANTVVSVKVDDGDLCPSDAPQGSCVVHQQKTDGNGNVSGSFVLPDVGAGTHTLRFLAAGEEKFDDNGISKGRPSYTNRSPEFTVVGEGGSDNSSSNSSGSSSSRGSSSSKSNGGSSNGGSNSNSSDSADDAQGSNESNESSSNGGSNGSSNGSANGGAEAETVYTDADGNTITKEEYDRLNAEADSSGTTSGSSNASSAPSASADAQKKATASASASSSAVARGTASNPSASASGAANTASTVQTVTYGAAFPWVGVVVLGVSVVGAAALLLTRKR